jgi:hypothetical protein
MCERARKRLPPGGWSRRQPEGWTPYWGRSRAGRYSRRSGLPHRGAGACSNEGGWLRIASELVGLVGFEGNEIFKTQLFEREGGGGEGGQKWSASVRLGSGKFRKMKNLVWPMRVTENRQRFGALSGKLPRRNRWLVVRRLSQWCESGAEAHALQTLAHGTDLPRFGRAVRVPFAFYRLSIWARGKWHSRN